jgi:hypothetical protein
MMVRRENILLLILVINCLVFNGCTSGNSSTGKTNSKEKWETISVNGSNKKPADPGELKNENFTSHLPAGFEMPADEVGQRLLREYGAVFAARGGAVAPNTVIFKDAAAVQSWQSGVSTAKETIGGVEIELQTPAMNALKKASGEAQQSGLTITPRGSDAARRSYRDTEELWASRVTPGLEYWAGKGRITAAEAARIRSLPPFDQVSEIFKLESEGMYFSKDMAKSIIYSVAPPGSSQHLSMLALDVAEHENPKVREILARSGWFQTVVSDLPHFTYLGAAENELPGLGLNKTSQQGRVFWTPSL